MTTMNDFAGNQLAIGDTVAVMPKNYRFRMVKATVIALTPQQVRVQYNNTWNYGPNGKMEQYLVSPMCVVKIN